MPTVLFVGGPADGERRELTELRPFIDVLYRPGAGLSVPLDAPADEWYSQFDMTLYRLERILVGKERLSFYVPDGTTSAEAVRLLIAGYRQPKESRS